MVEILIPITFFLATAAILLKYFDSRHKENLSLIEHNKQAGEIRSQVRRTPSPLNALKWGLLLFFSGVGLMAGKFIELNMGGYLGTTTIMCHGNGDDNDIITISCMMIGGGLGLFIFYLMSRNKYRNVEGPM